MVDFEADDGLGAAARKAALNPDVEQVIICTPDKDLGQCLTQDEKIIQYDRRKELRITYETVIEKFGVTPESIPDYLGLVGDTADGFPELKVGALNLPPPYSPTTTILKISLTIIWNGQCK